MRLARIGDVEDRGAALEIRRRRIGIVEVEFLMMTMVSPAIRILCECVPGGISFGDHDWIFGIAHVDDRGAVRRTHWPTKATPLRTMTWPPPQRRHIHLLHAMPL